MGIGSKLQDGHCRFDSMVAGGILSGKCRGVVVVHQLSKW